MTRKQVPVTVLSGYLGSGKTTVLNHVLHNRQGLKVACIVNDINIVNVESEQVTDEEEVLSCIEDRFVRLPNGCICCTIQHGLKQQINKLVEEDRFDYILIESTGISEPIPVAQTIRFADDDFGANRTRLDCLVTVVDANLLWQDFASGQLLINENESTSEDAPHDIVNLLLNQIQTCNLILLNKCDLVDENELIKLEGIIRYLQPSAKIIRTVNGQVELLEMLNTNLFNSEKMSTSAEWINETEKGSLNSKIVEYGFDSFVYQRRRPFHPVRLAECISNWPAEIIRTKGLIWLAAEGDVAANLSQVGPSIEFGPAGYWIANLPNDDIEDILRIEPAVRKNWHHQWGDRKTELVMVGIKMERKNIEDKLDACLLSEKEMDLDWSKFENPLPWLEEII